MTICLDTPEQISMWVLLSRRAQLKLQLKGLPTKGLVKWCKANIEGCENARTARDCVVPVEYAIAEADGPQDFSVVNIHVMYRHQSMFHDQGIFNDFTPESGFHEGLVRAYEAGVLKIIYTLEPCRESNGQIYVGV